VASTNLLVDSVSSEVDSCCCLRLRHAQFDQNAVPTIENHFGQVEDPLHRRRVELAKMICLEKVLDALEIGGRQSLKELVLLLDVVLAPVRVCIGVCFRAEWAERFIMWSRERPILVPSARRDSTALDLRVGGNA
jgi:hypothetical protein